ncbi:hypothetical protein NDI76_11925 [Halogeometricum sp. S1BR25-6]|uniref:Uncharacterized protein n=1 Tax=Halogeometricum salsisoli TaxID=2950536 RepID=A0ABU2GF94_9EURY|nr:hypothetical protein [Halogeometricum sp. S1BR25-6]MDS0299450.1 hypothetical protein [Halogeometricum sp. S1BR25-6]
MQRTDERERDAAEFSLDAESDDGWTGGASAPEADSRSSSGRLGGVFSPKLFLGVLLASAAAAVLGNGIPVIGLFGGLLGLLAVGFGVGLLASERRYLEVGAAGALVSGLLLVLSTMFSFFVPFAIDLVAQYGPAIAGAGAGAGLLASVLGHYLGRDLRDGLTREI